MANYLGLIRFVHFVLFVSSLIISISLFVSILQDSWVTLNISKSTYQDTLIYHSRNNIGLWKTCVYSVDKPTNCTSYNNILKFSKNKLTVGYGAPLRTRHRDFDIILLLLILATITSILASAATFLLINKLNQLVLWKVIFIPTIIFHCMSVLLGVSACIYGEYAFRNKMFVDGFKEDNPYIRGWCFMMSFCASVANLFNLTILIVIRLKLDNVIKKETLKVNNKK